MINNVNSGMSMPPPPPRSEQSLTAEQQTFITDTLAEFNADELSEEDALGIIEMFSEANIQPGAALEKAMSSAGFDAKSIGDIAAASDSGRPPPPPPPKQSTDEISSMVDYLAELLEETLAASESETLSDEDKQAILAQVFDKFNMEPSESIINTSA
ncbi:hypothetical protein EKO29_02765 [Colwellia sp. Arc7-635]|uniref:hypothetical protein n=1 Tax=Colwellia sp. Arc7-635 TaxID=2497879 RepID=UPI000F85AFD2|nr:hypothetical protein [Colwellia sp. Arc7-635]AZQ83076.1 hypothetical protein EKO29_02765 [Colwellia sp. Arc7-635]